MALAPLAQNLSQFKLPASAAPAAPAAAPASGSKPPISAFQNDNVDLSQHPDLVAVANALHQKILQGAPPNDLGRQQLVNYLKTNVNKVGGTTPLESANNFVQALPQAAQDTVGNALVKPIAQIGVSGYNAVKAGQDIAANGGKPSAQATQDLNAPRDLGPVIGKVQPLSTAPGKDFLDAAQAGFQAGGTLDAAAGAAGAIPELASKVDVRLGGQAASDAASAITAKTDAASIGKLQETIAPKITSKETQAIINEGRLTRGDSSTLFGKQPDIVTQSENVQQAAQVIHQNIPNASQMNDAQLSNALRTKISETSQSLKPQMEATPIHPDTAEKAQSTWETIKTQQQSEPEFMDNEAANKAFQGKFENYFNQALKGENMNDVWQARQAYDASVPANVKNATTQSPPQFQTRKTLWLQNRALLNSMINDTATGLGTKSQQAFSDMSSMYDARENIASKAKIDTTGAPGPLSKATVLKWGLGAGATLIGANAVLHKLGSTSVIAREISSHNTHAEYYHK